MQLLGEYNNFKDAAETAKTPAVKQHCTVHVLRQNRHGEVIIPKTEPKATEPPIPNFALPSQSWKDDYHDSKPTAG